MREVTGMKPRTATAEKKELIIQKAKELFCDNGYDNTSTRELAEAAGLSVAGVYYFFRDKEEILYTILRQSIVDLNYATAAAIVEDDDPEVNLRRTIISLCRHSLSHRKELFILNREEGRLQAEQRQVIHKFRRDSYEKIMNEVRRIQAQGKLSGRSPQLLVFSIYANTTWFSRWFHEDGQLSFDELASEMADGIMSGSLK